MSAAVGEIKKLNDQLSQLRQENINLKVYLDTGDGHDDGGERCVKGG